MATRKLSMNQLSKPVRSFLSRIRNGDRIVVEDDSGRARYGITPYVESTAPEKKRALARMARLQRKTREAMEQQGISEVDVKREILRDD